MEQTALIAELVEAHRKALPLLSLLAVEEARGAKLAAKRLPFPPSTKKREAYEAAKEAIRNGEDFLRSQGWTENAIDGHWQNAA